MTLTKVVEQNKVGELLDRGREALQNAGIDEAREECDRILMHLLGCARSALYFKAQETLKQDLKNKFLDILEQRTQRVPLAYLLQEADFWQETLYVDQGCLIPRPETEILVEQVLRVVKQESKETFSFLDIGTGSGAIAIAILRSCDNAKATLLDISEDALRITRKNLDRYGVDSRAQCVLGDLFKPFLAQEKWDWIISNPPYLSSEDMAQMQEELKAEPRVALDGGKDGLDCYRVIIREAKGHLTQNGGLALEVGLGQAEMVSKWLQEAGYDNIQVFKDHLKVDRVIIARAQS